MAKSQFIQSAQTAATALANAISACGAVAEVWTDRSYATGITDADLTAMSVQFTAAQLAQFITLVAAIQTFAVANHAKYNAIRADL